jgi:release factor glutamine methyltransferase
MEKKTQPRQKNNPSTGIMLPTPSTSHLSFDRIYEPAEDSYLLLDTLSSATEISFLVSRFSGSPSPFVVEIGTGSGVVLSFLHSNAGLIFGREDVVTAGVDVNVHACRATASTVQISEKDQAGGHGFYLGNTLGNLTSSLRAGTVDVLVFNPPYVPTEVLPSYEIIEGAGEFEEDGRLLELSYAGGVDGMEVTDRLLDTLPDVLSTKGIAYVLLCAQNRPEKVKERIQGWEGGWEVETVGSSGKKAGWEKLVVIRISRLRE